MSGFTKAYQETEGKGVVHDIVSGLKVDIVDIATKTEKSKGPMDEEVEVSVKQIISFLGKRDNITGDKPKILDVGCCIGRELRCLDASLMQPAELYGVDVMTAVLDKAKELGPKNCTYTKGDVHSLPFDDGYFDVVFCKRVLIHSPDVKKAMEEMIRVLKCGGFALFVEGDISAFHFHTTDARMSVVDREKLKATINSSQNANIVSLTRGIMKNMSTVDNVNITGIASVISDISIMHQYSSGIVKKLVDDNIVSQEDADYYLDGLQYPEKVGYPLYSGIMFFMSCIKN